MNKSVKTDLGNKEVFSRNLNRHLKNTNSLQKDVAKAVGVSAGTFCDWCKGRAYPRMDKVQLLAEYFGISKSDLVEDVYIAKETVLEEDQEVLDLLHKVPKAKRSEAVALCKAVLSSLAKF
jgi:transcriptional regulator with XRE-family HTH domain